MYLGLDLGTSGLRGLLVSAEGEPAGDKSAEYAVNTPQEGWSEQDPADWIKAIREVAAQLRSAYPKEFAAIKGIGVAGHMHGATTLDRSGKVVRPCILWNDGRAENEAAELDAMPEFRGQSGNIVFPGFTAPKLLWMARHEPDNFARVDKVLLPKDYIVYWLTGRLVTEMSDAAGTSWLDVGNREWSDELIEKSGMVRSHLPELIEGSELVGTLDNSVADELGLRADVGVVAGGGDNAVAACGIGALAEGQGFLSLGTSGVLLAAKDQYAPAPASAVHTFCHAVPEKWYQMGVTLSATDSLNWLANNVGRTVKELASQFTDRPSGPSSVLFLPYLSGERTPHNDVNARATFIGMSRATDCKVLCQAVMEGVGFALRDCLQALKSTGTILPGAFAIGGGSRSDFWLETLANTLNLPLHLPEKGDFGAAMGAARLAMAGVSGQPPSSVMTQPKIQRSYEPQPNLVAAYEAAYIRYTESYSVLKEIS
ncbi:MAG: xylulokinase [bacterium]